MFCCIQASFYNLVMLFSAFRLRNHKYYSIHTFSLSSYVVIYLQRFQFCFFGLLFLFLISQHFSLWHIFWEWHSSFKASGRLSFSVLAALYICSVQIFCISGTFEFYQRECLFCMDSDYLYRYIFVLVQSAE